MARVRRPVSRMRSLGLERDFEGDFAKGLVKGLIEGEIIATEKR